MYLLHIETATKVCSVALSKDNILLDEISEEGEGYVHGERLTILIQKILEKNIVSLSDIGAISVGLGPGSYTGLRIGLSTAKGICYGLNIPIIGISSLECVIKIARQKYFNKKILAAFDARRMEVFRRFEDEEGNIIEMDAPEIIIENSYIDEDNMVWVGDANQKCKGVMKNKNIIYDDALQISASGQLETAWNRFQNNDFDDLAYLVPNYTKEFNQIT